MGKGLLITLEGVDRAGKSTQAGRLVATLEARGLPVVCFREPGGTQLGEEIRRVLLGVNDPLGMRAEMLLYMAARAQLVEEEIEPAIAAGRIVVLDRYLLSTICYQGYGGGLELEEVRTVGRIATGGRLPDWTIILDLAVERAIERQAHGSDRIERRDRAYHERVREGYLLEAAAAPERTRVIDASRCVDAVFADILSEVERVLAAAGWT